MGGTVDYIDCPHCNTVEGAINEFNYKSGEEFIHCPHCGYHRRFYITNWDKKEDTEMLVDGEPTEAPWTPEYEIFECREPFGAFDVRYIDGNGECGSFIEKENEEEFMDQIEDLIAEGLIESAMISKYVDGEIIKKQIK